MDIAGMGEKPAMRSGPCSLMVWILAAAMISLTSSQVDRTKPPRPRRRVYEARASLAPTMAAQACTGSSEARLSRHSLSSALRTSGYFSRLALYRYQE
jgi:hypothetical protein